MRLPSFCAIYGQWVPGISSFRKSWAADAKPAGVSLSKIMAAGKTDVPAGAMCYIEDT
jgi:hypothetical protein